MNWQSDGTINGYTDQPHLGSAMSNGEKGHYFRKHGLGDWSVKEKKIIREVFNSSDNIDGKHIKFILGSQVMNEGITLEYDSGNTRTTLDVIQSRSLLLDARIAYAKAERDFTISKFALAFQIGSLTLNSIKTL